MKTFFTLLTSLVVLFSVHSERAAAEIITQDAALKLMAKSGCIACHAIDKLKLGPAYKDVAKRYAAPDATTKAYLAGKAPLDYLMNRVRHGVKIPDRHWKEAKGMMTPNPVARISDENLKSLVTFILSLK